MALTDTHRHGYCRVWGTLRADGSLLPAIFCLALEFDDYKDGDDDDDGEDEDEDDGGDFEKRSHAA